MCSKKIKLIATLVAVSLATNSIANTLIANASSLDKEVSSYLDEQNYTVIDVTEFGADPTGKLDSVQAVTKALEYAKEIEGAKKIYFPQGEYTFYPENAPKRELYVSNTVGTNQNYKIKNIGILVEDMNDVVIDGGGSHFSYHGFQTAFASIRSENVRFENFSFDYVNPKVVDVTVEETGVENRNAYRILYIPETYDYEISDNGINWYGEKSPITGQYYWTGRNAFNYTQYYDANTGETRRNGSLFSNVSNIEQLEDNRVKVTYNASEEYSDLGRVYQMRETTRDTPGAFFWESKDVEVKNVDVQYLHGFGFVGQFTENITIDGVNFKAREGSGRATAGFADFIQMSGTKGKIKITNSSFSNPHDDPINVHGTYLEVVEKIAPNKVKVRYMHNETAGFPQFYIGDEVEFFTKTTMLPVENSVAKVIDVEGPSGTSSESSLTDIIITLDKDISDEIVAGNTHVVENITYTPEVEITNNKFVETPTRGILVTTRKPVLIENNYFDGMGMSSIFISSDAHQWYESGPTNDVTIKNNIFDRSEGPVIYFGPTNQVVDENNTIHNNIVIEDNTFNIKDTTVLNGKSVGNLTFKNNIINRYNSNAKVEISSGKNELEVGETLGLTVDKQGETLSSPMFVFTGANNITIEDNKYDNGLNLRVNTSNMSNPSESINIIGDDLKINANNQKSGQGDVKYYSSNENVIKISKDGVVTAIGSGEAEVKAFVISDTRVYESNTITFNVSGDGNISGGDEEVNLELSNEWSIVREDNSKWELLSDKSLKVMTSGGSLWATGNSANNIFLSEIVESSNEYTVTTKMSGKTQSGYEESGIVIYSDDDNYVAIQRKHNNGSPSIKIVTENEGQANESREVAEIDSNDIYFKLERSNDSFKGYYSVDGSEWIQVGDELSNSGISGDAKVGILTANPNASHEFIFSEFKVNDKEINFGQEVAREGFGLWNLDINGADLLSDFNNNTESYNAVVPSGIEYINVDLEAIESNTKIEIYSDDEKIAEGVGTLKSDISIDNSVESKNISIKLTSNSGETKTYSIKLDRFKDSESKLSNIIVSGIEGMPAFSDNRYFYTANGSTTSDTMNVTLESKSPNSKLIVLVNGEIISNKEGNSFNRDIKLVTGINSVQVYSIAEDGISKSMYRLSVIRRESNDVSLSELKVNGNLLEGFASDKFNYSYNVDKNVESINIETIKNGENSKVEIFNGNVKFEGQNADVPIALGTNTIIVKVTSEDYSKINYYRVLVNRQFEGNAALENLEVEGIELTPEFDPNVNSYSGVLPSGVNIAKIKARTVENNANIAISLEGEEKIYKTNEEEAAFYIENENSIVSVSVQAEDGTVKEYKINLGVTSSLQIDKEQMTVIATSEHPNVGTEGVASFAIDDNISTIWHTKYSPKDELPQSITVELGGKYLIDKYEYLPRQSGGTNGIITKYQLQISTDGEKFKTVAKGTWSSDTSKKVIEFDESMATHVRLVALQGIGGFASAAELNVFEKDTIPNSPSNLEIKDKYDDSATISWEKPEDDYGIIGYTIFKDGKVIDEVSADTFEYKLDDLDKFKENSIEVAAKNRQGKLSKKINLNISLGDLEEDNNVDKSILQALVDKVEGLDSTKYIPSTWIPFANALEAANTVLSNENVTEEEVNEVYNTLLKAYLGLRLTPDKSLLEELIKEVESIDLTQYTAKSAKVVEKALEKANKVLKNEESTQEEVDLALAKLKEAKNSLIASDSTSKTDSSSTSSSNNSGSNENLNSNKLPKTGTAGGAVGTLISGIAALLGGLGLSRKKNGK